MKIVYIPSVFISKRLGINDEKSHSMMADHNTMTYLIAAVDILTITYLRR